jgi:hypothetical protein
MYFDWADGIGWQEIVRNVRFWWMVRAFIGMIYCNFLGWILDINGKGAAKTSCF